MKNLLLLLTLLLGVNIATAQTSIIKTWVLQNPELAVEYNTLTFYSNGQMLCQSVNLLTKQQGSVTFSWKLNENKSVLTLTKDDGGSYRINIILGENTLTMMNDNNVENNDYLAVSGSESDHYISRVQFAVDTYGADASLRKNGIPSSSRESGYSFQPRYSVCSGCFGLGRCTYCNGSGTTTYDFHNYVACPSCHGDGVCYLCGGAGKVKNY